MSRSLVLCFGKVDAALEASKQLTNQVVALDDLPDEATSSALLIIAPTQQQVCSLNRLHQRWQSCEHVRPA